MVAMPLFHVGGSSYAQFGIHAGIPSIMTREVDGASLAGALLAGATRTFLVPAVLGKVMEMGSDAIKSCSTSCAHVRLRRLADAARAAANGLEKSSRTPTSCRYTA